MLSLLNFSLSIGKSELHATHLSIGWMISGMTPRPRPVTIQFLAVSATPGKTFARLMPAPQHMRLIVKPEQLGLPKKDFQHWT